MRRKSKRWIRNGLVAQQLDRGIGSILAAPRSSHHVYIPRGITGRAFMRAMSSAGSSWRRSSPTATDAPVCFARSLRTSMIFFFARTPRRSDVRADARKRKRTGSYASSRNCAAAAVSEYILEMLTANERL